MTISINGYIFLTFGPTRAGKSSFLNTISKKLLCEVGNKIKEGTTIDVTPYDFTIKFNGENQMMLIFDVPGIFDTRLRVTNNQINEKIKIGILEKTEKSSLDAILVFESCANDV